jgi:uncharacterized membrane protein YeiB
MLVARGAPDRVLVRRGLALFVLGLLIWPYVPRVYLILPHYGVLLALVPLLRRIPTRALLPLAGLAFLVPSVITAVVHDHGMRGAPQPADYGDLASLRYLAGHLLWTGGYPLVGWVGFVLVGLWVARRPLEDHGANLALLGGGVAVALTQPLCAAVFRALDGTTHDPDAQGLAAFFDGSAHANSTAWYVISSGTAVASIAACLLVAPALQPYVRPVCRLGAMMLSAYLLHLAIGNWLWWEWRDRETPGLATQVFVVVVVFGTFAIAAELWRRVFRRGPLESVLRRLSG